MLINQHKNCLILRSNKCGCKGLCTSRKHQLMLLHLSTELQAPKTCNFTLDTWMISVMVTWECSVFVINSVLGLFFWESSLGISLWSAEKNIYLLELSVTYGNIYLWKIPRGDSGAHPDLVMSGVTWPWRWRSCLQCDSACWHKSNQELSCPFVVVCHGHKSHWFEDYES